MDQIKLAAAGKLYGCLSSDGRFLEFRRRGQVVRFDVQASIQTGRAVVSAVRADEQRVGQRADEQARPKP